VILAVRPGTVRTDEDAGPTITAQMALFIRFVHVGLSEASDSDCCYRCFQSLGLAFRFVDNQ
jgi:hypothetical protein